LKSAADNLPSGRRILAGLLSAPIAHSASPAMYERAAEALGRA
jgi:shikimate dehydrogenase